MEGAVRRLLKEYGSMPKRRLPMEPFRRAFRHASWTEARGLPRTESSERLEHVGDALLGAIVAAYAAQRYPDQDEGFLTRFREQLVCGARLAALARALDLGRHLRAASEAVRQSDAALEDCFEAFCGALYVAAGEPGLGFRLVNSFAVAVFERHVDFSSICQQDGRSLRQHLVRLVRQHTGSDPVFSCEAKPDGFVASVQDARQGTLGTGLGPTRAEAEDQAARDAIAFYS